MLGKNSDWASAVFLIVSLMLVASVVFWLPNATAAGGTKYYKGSEEALAFRDPGGGGSCSTADKDQDGQSVCGGDCNDRDRTIFRGAIEYCGNDVDEDCDGVADACSVTSVLDTTQDHYNLNEEVKLT